MKRCPKCAKVYDKLWMLCINCNVQLIDAEGQAAASAPDSKSAPSAKKSGQSVELQIGQYLLNRLGILSLVAGLAFFIVYSFRYIGPPAKIMTGFGIAALLLFLGKFMERKKDMQWFGVGLIGGGWSLAYFTTYAMHHIESVRVIHNANLGLIALVAVTSLLMIDLMRYKSQTITTLVFVLGFFTAGLGKITPYSLVYAALLSFSLVAVIYRMRWNRLMLFAVAASYVTHLVWIGPEIFVSGHMQQMSLDMARFYLSAGFLTLYYLLFTLAPFLTTEENEDDRQTQTASTLLNAFCYGVLMFREATHINPEWRFHIAIGVGIFSIAAAAFARYVSKRDNLVVTHMTLAIAAITVSYPLKFVDRWVDIAWLCEVPLLVFLGLYFRRALYRVLGWILAFVMTLKVFGLYAAAQSQPVIAGRFLTERSLILIVAIFSFYAASLIYTYFRDSVALKDGETFIGRALFVTATVFLWTLSFSDIHPHWMSISWALVAFSFLVIGFLIKDKWFRFTALGLIGLIALRVVLYDIKDLPTLYRIALFIGMGVALLLASFVYGKVAIAQKKKGDGR